MKADIELVMYDFAGAFGEATCNEKHQIDKGIQTFLQLVSDKFACQARMAFLQTLAVPRSSDQPSDVGHLEQCNRSIAEVGLERALHDNLITLQDLVDLSCNPHLLWQLHCLLVTREQDLAPAAGPEGTAHDAV